jgi:hypothetical protein
MEKGQLPVFAELALDAHTQDSTTKVRCKFAGTSNPRHLRVIHALLLRPRKREEIDRIAGASNGPDLIAELRRRGLSVPCERTPAIDRDGFPIKPGVYKFDQDDQRKIFRWMRLCNKKVKR